MAGWSLNYVFDVDEKNRIIYEKIHGIWQAKTAQDYHEDFKAAVEPLLDQPWAKLVDLSGWKTSYPAVIGIIGKHLKWCREHNLALSVNVLSNPSTFRQLKEMFKKGKTGVMSETFRTLQEGQKHLEEHWIGKAGISTPSSKGSLDRPSL